MRDPFRRSDSRPREDGIIVDWCRLGEERRVSGPCSERRAVVERRRLGARSLLEYVSRKADARYRNRAECRDMATRAPSSSIRDRAVGSPCGLAAPATWTPRMPSPASHARRAPSEPTARSVGATATGRTRSARREALRKAGRPGIVDRSAEDGQLLRFPSGDASGRGCFSTRQSPRVVPHWLQTTIPSTPDARSGMAKRVLPQLGHVTRPVLGLGI